MLDKLFAFFKRDFLEAASYKFSFVSSIFSVFLSSATFFFISRLIPGGENTSLAPYGGDYFSFVIIGIAFSGFLQIFQQGFPGYIQNAQITGTLEVLLVSRTNIPTILFGSSIYNFLFYLATSIFQIGVAIFVFGLTLGKINWIGFFVVFILSAVCYLSIGILSASFLLVFKSGDPFSWVFGSLSGLFGGVFFPYAVLPPWIRWISYCLPITHTLNGLRYSLLSSASFSQILPSILALLGFAVVLLPLSLYVFSHSLLKAKKDGTLTHY